MTAHVSEIQSPGAPGALPASICGGGAEAPPWVFAVVGTALDKIAAKDGEVWQPQLAVRTPGMSLRRLEGAYKTLWSLRVSGALALDEAGFELACAEAYRLLGSQVAASGHPYAVRWWNFVPGILEPLGALEHRYMVFNAGRFQALAAAGLAEAGAGGPKDWGRLATASGVGHAGGDFVLHCLSARSPGRQIENPRQIPAWRYSLRYGPKPPCFARATRITRGGRGAWLLVGGTASVRGEDSFHQDDLRGQLEETLRNLAALVAAAEGGEPARENAEEQSALLGRYRELRIYHPRREHGERLEQELRRRLGPGVRLEMVEADLCRPELLVEIEGLAELQS